MSIQVPEYFRASIEATKVDYVRLGNSGLRVSVPILGTMGFGTPDWASWVCVLPMILVTNY